MTVQLGDINTNLTLSDNYSEVLNRISRNIEKMVEIQSRGSKKVVNEADRLKASYDKIAASLDPAIARSQKYDKTVDVLKKSLAAGAISQDDFNKKLALAEQKYNGNQRVTKILEVETRKLEKSYEKLAHSLDPVNRKTDQYEENLDTLNRALKANIIGQDTYNKRLSQLNKTLDDSNQRINRLGQNLTEVGSNITRLSLPLAAVGGFALKTSIDFESSFAGVRKTVTATEPELRKMAQAMRDMAAGPNAIPVDVNDLNAIAEAAGQLGIAKEDVLKFTETIAALGEASNLSYEEGATSLAQFQNIFGAAGKDVDRLASTIVALGNKGASTEKQIVEMGLRIAGAGKQIGLTQGEVLGIASALSSVGIEAEAGGSAISTLMINMRLAVSKGGDELHNFNEVAKTALPAGKDFATVFGEDAATGVQAFINGLVNIEDSGGDVIRVLDDMGISGIRIRDATTRAAGAGDLLENSLKLQKTAWEENNALTEEARKRYATTESQLKLVWQRFKDIGITLGNSLVPVLREMLTVLEPIMKLLAHFAELFGRLPGPIKLVVVGIGGLTLATGPALFVIGQMMQMWATFVQIAPKIAAHFAAIRLSVLGMTAVIAGVLLGLDHIITKWKEAMSAAIEYNIQTGNLEGRALTFVQNARQSGGKVTSEALQQAKKDLADLESQVNSADQTVKKLQKTIKEGSPDQAFIARKDLIEAQTSLNGLRGAYDRLKKSVSNATIEQKKQEEAVEEINPDIKIQNKELENTAKQLANIIALQKEEARYLREKMAIASQGPGADQQHVYEQLQKINDEHEYRLNLLDKIEQFGVKIGTQLADTDRELKKLEKDIDLKFKLQFINPKGQIPQLRSGIIDLFGGVQSAIDQGMNNLLDHLRELSKTQALDTLAGRSTDPVIQANDEMYAALASENAEFWQDYSAEVRGGWKTTADHIRDEMDKVRAAYESGVEGALTVAEAEEELGRLRDRLVSETLSTWSSALGFLADRFGGFFNYLNDLVNGLQQAQQFGQSIGQLTSLMGGSAGTASAAGALGGVAAAFVVVYDIVDKLIKDSKTRNYGTYGDFGIEDFRSGMSEIGQQAGELTRSIRDTVRSLEDALRISVEDLADIGIKVRNDGKRVKAYVEGVLIGVFGSVEDAIQAALVQALTDPSTTLHGLSDLMREGLTTTSIADFDDLVDLLETLREISDLNLTQGAIQMQETVRRLDEMFRLLERMPGSMATLQGFTGVVTTEIDAWLAWRRSITGEQESAAEIQARQQREKAMFEAQKAMRIADLKLREVELRIQRDMLRARGTIFRGNAQIDQTEIENQGRVLQAKAALVTAEVDLYKAQLSAIDAALLAIGDLIRQLEAIPDIDLGSSKPGRAGGGAGDSVRDFINDRRFQLSLEGMSEYRRQLAEIERQYREIGKPTAELIALRNQEIDQLNRLRNREVATNFQEFMGLVSPFDQIRKTAADLIADIKDSPFGDARKATMIGRVMGEVDRQIHRMSQEMARGLFGEMLGDLERFGVEEGLQLQLRQSMAIIEHTLKMAHYQEEIEILRAKGKLTAEQMRLLDESFAVLRNINPLTIAGGVSDRQPLTPTGQDLRDALAEREANEANQLAEALKRARESLNRYKDDGLDPLTKDLKEIFKNFAEIKLYMGATPEVVETFNKAVKNAVDRFLDPIRESQRDLFFSENSAIDPMTQWAQLQLERDSLIARFRAGDLSVVDEIANFGSELMDLAGDVIPMGSRAYEQIQNDWDRFLSEVQISVPGMIDVDSAPMQVVGMNDLTAIGEAQVDRLDMLYASQVRTNEHLQNLNMKVGYTGGLDSVN